MFSQNSSYFESIEYITDFKLEDLRDWLDCLSPPAGEQEGLTATIFNSNQKAANRSSAGCFFCTTKFHILSCAKRFCLKSVCKILKMSYIRSLIYLLFYILISFIL